MEGIFCFYLRIVYTYIEPRWLFYDGGGSGLRFSFWLYSVYREYKELLKVYVVVKGLAADTAVYGILW